MNPGSGDLGLQLYFDFGCNSTICLCVVVCVCVCVLEDKMIVTSLYKVLDGGYTLTLELVDTSLRMVECSKPSLRNLNRRHRASNSWL